MKTLFLHLGTHKTGTSSLQYYLNKYQNILKEGEACYPYIRTSCKRDIWSNSPFINGSFLIEPNNNKHFKSGLKRIIKSFKSYNKVIISEEFLSLLLIYPNKHPWYKGINVEENLMIFKKFCNSNDINIIPIIYLRRQDKFAESMMSEYAKSCFYYDSVFDFVKDFDLFLDYHSLVKKISSIFNNNLIVKNYDAIINNDICDDFFNTINLKSYAKKEININPKLELNALYFQKILIQNRKASTKLCYKTLMDGYHHFKNSSIFSKEDAIKIMDIYKNSNILLTKNYHVTFDNLYLNYEYKYDPNNQYMADDIKKFIINNEIYIKEEIYNAKTSTKIKNFLKRFKFFKLLNNIIKKFLLCK